MNNTNLLKKRRNPLKGAVLFTVLAVMMVILILVLATVGLSSVASRRAYKEYHDAQIAATGQSVVNSVLESIKPGGANESLGIDIYKAAANSPGTPYEVLVSNGGNLGHGLGTVEKLEFTYAGMDKETGYYISGNNYPILKVTATVRMGNEVSTYTQYVSGMVNIPGGGGDGGLIGTNAVSATGTGMNVLGPVGGGLNNGKATGEKLSVTNAGIYSGVQFFNSSLYINTHKVFLYRANRPASSYDAKATSDYQGVFVMGDMEFQNNADFLSEYAGTSDIETPYMFVTGNINFPNGMAVGTCTDGMLSSGLVAGDVSVDVNDVKNRIGNKINIYCGSLTTPDDSKFIRAVSDIYCYDESKTSMLGGLDNSALTEWASGLTKTKILNCQVQGDVKTKGSLIVGNSKSSTVNITGSVYVEKLLRLYNNGPKINGKVSAHVLRVPVAVDSLDGLKALLGCSEVEFDYFVDGTNKCRDKNFNEITVDLTTKTIDEYIDGWLSSASGMTEKFPAAKELDQILGVNFNSGVGSSGSDQLTAVNEQNYNITAAPMANKIIQNPSEMHNRFYVDDGTGNITLKGSKTGSGAVTTNEYTAFNGELNRAGYKKINDCWYGLITETEYNSNLDAHNNPNKKTVTVGGASKEINVVERDYSVNPNQFYKYLDTSVDYVQKEGSEFLITESCVLKGEHQNVTIRVRPGADVSNPLWIELDGFSLTGNGKIVVEDIIKQADGKFFDASGKCTKAAPVYFYIKDNTSATFNSTKLVTEYYDETYFKNSNALTSKLIVPGSNVPDELKPGIYIYGSNDEAHGVKLDASGNPQKDAKGNIMRNETLKIINNAVVTAYIIAPRAALDVTNAGNAGADIEYNGKNYKGLIAGLIGSAIVGDVINVENDVTLVYINNSDDTEKDPISKFGYAPISGFSSY